MPAFNTICRSLLVRKFIVSVGFMVCYIFKIVRNIIPNKRI